MFFEGVGINQDVVGVSNAKEVKVIAKAIIGVGLH